MATFILRPKIDTDHSDNWIYTVKSDPTKDYWEHIFGSDDSLYLSAPTNKVAGTLALIDENDLPSVSSADGKMTALTVYARGKATGGGAFYLYCSLYPYGSPLSIIGDDVYVTHSYVFDISAHNGLHELHDIEIGGNVSSHYGSGDKYLDYVYAEIDYDPAVPTVSYQWIRALASGNLAAFNAAGSYFTWIKEWGFEVRLKSTQEMVKTVTWTGRIVQNYGWDTELGTDDLEYGTTYEGRGYCVTDDGIGYRAWVTFITREAPPPTLTNIGAENNGVFARTILTGEIVNFGSVIIERGFEYKIQEAEPAGGDTGTEVKETSAGFEGGEYSLRNKELYNLQYEDEENIVWWFRAYCMVGEIKYVADSWMKNLPTVTTQDMTSINYNKADGNGLIVSEGASELTMRGFEVIHEFSGRLPDSWRFEIGGFEGEPEQVIVHDSFGVTIIDIYWAGTLIKTVYETYAIAVGAYSITIGRMLFGWPIMQDCLVEGKDYKCKAFAENEFGRVYGEEVDFSTWARTYFSEDPPIVGEISVIKNENIENLPVGITATRRGFRYGTTEAADEFDVHENGSFTNGPYSMMLSDLLPDTTYYIYAYVVIEGIVYEGSLETLTTDPEGTEDEDEYPTPHYSPHGQDYREMETKVFAEVLASQGIIDFSGGKKTLPITNHLIQTNPDAKTIADNYLNRFKLAKTRMSVSYPTPLPFEREDTIDFSFGKVKFKENDLGVVTFKEDGQGVLGFADQITMIIKQINSVGLTKTPESIEYVADLDLEHE